jgi:hypothetical protein
MKKEKVCNNKKAKKLILMKIIQGNAVLKNSNKNQ